LGTVLDPLADKAMLLSALFLFLRRQLLSHQACRYGLYWLVVSRDVMLIAGDLLFKVM